MILAECILLKHALLDPFNERFLFLSDMVAKCCPANCYGWEMVCSCFNEIPQPGTLGYLDAVYNMTSSLLNCSVLLLQCLAKQLDVSWCFLQCSAAQASKGNFVRSSHFPAGASSNVLQLKRLRETLSAALIFQGIGALINLLTLSCPLAFSTLAICSVLSTIFLFYGQFQKKAAKFTQEFSASANEVRAMAGQVSLYRHSRKCCFYGSWYLSFNTLYRSTQFFAVLLGGMSILTGHVSAEQLMKYVLYCEWLIYAAWRLEDNLSSLLQAIGAREKVFQLMLTRAAPVRNVLNLLSPIHEYTCLIFFLISFVVQTAFPFPNLAKAVLSGSGKSTLMNLLLRLYEPTSGEEPHLFHMDVKSNISYGCSRDIKQQDVEWAAKQANAHEFISSLPNGYETIVDDGWLSGGQKQRIAIARAIVRDPAILILDEATRALDAENEYYIARLLHAFRNDCRVKRTVIVIAHRPSTIKAADNIMVMDVRTKTDDLA
ncbi:hypothetical protein TEA_007420 [Camellia sinensis var. sinensis]|uniref:ABC transporter domain-containing protein n=1 Tax=Camellia sinensis var. sinensis TaxID=542762 RepID=A0A4S4EBU9_CAMSN|nr:hypothetical protein TEA_007420 [Camellia sinensis var. sinensis]